MIRHMKYVRANAAILSTLPATQIEIKRKTGLATSTVRKHLWALLEAKLIHAKGADYIVMLTLGMVFSHGPALNQIIERGPLKDNAEEHQNALDRILEVLPGTEAQIAARLDQTRSCVRKRLKQMKEDALVVKEGTVFEAVVYAPAQPVFNGIKSVWIGGGYGQIPCIA